MSYQWLGLVVFFSLVFGGKGQAQQGQAPPKEAASPARELPADAPVITISGLCDSGLATSLAPKPAAAGKAVDPSCKTVVTRQQYESLLGAIGAKPTVYHSTRFATRYKELLLFGEQARKWGIEKDPKFQEKARYSYLQDLEQFARVHMQQQAMQITEEEAAQYYKDHPERFMRIHLAQISVPKQKGENTTGGGVPAKLDPTQLAEMHKLALKVQKEAAAGADPDKLEEKIYKIAGDASVPDTDLGEPVREEVPAEYRELIFKLEPGQVSQVTEDDHEYLIFKCIAKHMIPPSDAKNFLVWLRVKDAMQALKDSIKTEFNEEYFSGAAPAAQNNTGTEKTQ
jgi:hypothetical protein